MPTELMTLPLVGRQGRRASGERSPVSSRLSSIARRLTQGWESLTPRELDVASLVAEGLSYLDIGERLFLSRRTVETHVAHVFTKLGIRMRAALTEAVRRGR
jgi:DNA-binding NarL/FixJ family response regulator